MFWFFIEMFMEILNDFVFAEFRVLNLNPTKDADLIRKRRITNYNIADHRYALLISDKHSLIQ